LVAILLIFLKKEYIIELTRKKALLESLKSIPDFRVDIGKI